MAFMRAMIRSKIKAINGKVAAFGDAAEMLPTTGMRSEVEWLVALTPKSGLTASGELRHFPL